MSKDKKKIIVKVQEESIMVYDDIAKDGVDLVANDTEGKKHALQIVKDMLEE